MKNVLLLIIIIQGMIMSCSPISQKKLVKKFQETENQFQDHTGFMLYDPLKQRTIFEYNSADYFTPASNTKIFTLFAGLNIIGDSIPALRYLEKGDSVFFWGTGDPSFLYSNVFNNGRTYNFLRAKSGQLYYASPKYFTTHFGPGWSWEDYEFTFSSERSPFPMFGNTFEVHDRDVLETVPPYFKSLLIEARDSLEKSNVKRSPYSNLTTYFPGYLRTTKWVKPFVTDSSVVVRLLSDTLARKVRSLGVKETLGSKIFYGTPADSIYKVMMQNSDNFIAEQLLLVCADILGDSLAPEIPIEYVTKNFLSDLPDKPVWIDGSGLSRYNLFTPRSIVRLWEKMYHQIERERLFKIVAVGGVSGTLKNLYKAETPYVFGKTGTLSNVHCLSGYLITKKGETLIFSFMNTNFTVPTREIRQRMEEILVLIRDNY